MPRKDLTKIAERIAQLEELQKKSNHHQKPKPIKLTDKVSYIYEKEKDCFVLLYSGKRIKVLSRDALTNLIEALPDKATKEDVIDTCKKVGINIHPSLVLYLMRLLTHPIFGFELKIEKKKAILEKPESLSIWESLKKTLVLEKDLIDNPLL